MYWYFNVILHHKSVKEFMTMKAKELQGLIEQIYAERLIKLQELEHRPPGKGWFRASATGFCYRKNFYSTNEVDQSNPVNNKTMRIFRLGTLIHQDLQKSLEFYISKKQRQSI
jgi:hypothetical protein